MVSSNRIATLTSSPQLRLLTYAQASKPSDMECKGVREPPLLIEELWTLGGFRRMEKSALFKDVATGRLTMIQWMPPYPGVYGQHELDLMDFFFKEDKKNERGKDVGLNLRGAGSGMGIQSEYIQNTLHKVLIENKNFKGNWMAVNLWKESRLRVLPNLPLN